MAARREWVIVIALLAVAVVLIVAIAVFVLKMPSGPAAPSGQAVYTQLQLDYFRDIAFEPPEYGNSSSLIYRWDGDLRINITGEPEYSDIDAVLSAMEELKGLTGNVSLSLTDSDANVIVYVGNEAPILDYLEINDTSYSHGGFFFWTLDDSVTVNRSVIAISSDYYSGAARANNLRYGLAYVLGLHGLSPLYPDSIFYTGYAQVDHYSDLDRALVRMLYDDRVKAGMSESEALAAFGADA
jgi:Protein of unknown function (DUF2927)